MSSQPKNYRSGDDIYDNQSCDGFYNMNSLRNINISNSFPPIGTFTIDTSSIGQTSNNLFDVDDNLVNNSNIFNTNNVNITNGVNNSNLTSSGSNNCNDTNQTTRETGIIEKLLHSYGFIQCCERQARLFFHFSQFSGNIDHLKIGDPVEFEMTYDRRTGKPIASQVTKIAPEVVLSEERVTGTVTTEIRTDSSNNSTSNDTTGRISYENRGECFFLPYTKDHVEGNVILCAGDKVSFQVATNQRGNLGACHIRLENPKKPVRYRGVVCSKKESFGFIERADVVKEIFFHFSEAEGSIELRPGDDVEFTIQTRSGKEFACNITRLPPGSVIFEDVDTKIYKGQVLKPLDRNNQIRHNGDTLPGRIRYRAADHSEVEVPFGDKDQKGDFTLKHGDWVQFLLATDRRDQLQRATSISLSDESFGVSGEKREQGVVASLKDGFGFLRCVERNVNLFFHFTEVLDTSREIRVGDEVEFTVVQEPRIMYGNNRASAIRIKHLQSGTVQFETLVASNKEGIITREAPRSPVKSQERVEGGVISYDQEDNTKKTIMYFLKDCDIPPRTGDRVRFDICLVKRNKELVAINVVEIPNRKTEQSDNHDTITNGQNGYSTFKEDDDAFISLNNNIQNGQNGQNTTTTFRGFIAVLKENFGFIETINHDAEVFFHFSNYIGNPSWLELGQEVEYSLSPNGNSVTTGNCLPAENVRTLPKGIIPQPMIIDKIYNGIVTRPLRCINPDQDEYSGMVEIMNNDNTII